MTAIDVYFDYRSPFAYLASELLPDFADRSSVELRWKPIDIMQLSNYASGLPYSPVKRRYVAIDAARSAEYHGVAMRMPKPHPVLSSMALGLAFSTLSEPSFAELHRALFRAAWRDQHDIGSRDVLADCISSVGGPVDDWLEQAESPVSVAGLEALTADAEACGVFGVPTMVVEGEIFWGLDSLPMFEWRLEGGRPRD
jgi:2-hydroxychromene-2-carboxylate isomerase